MTTYTNNEKRYSPNPSKKTNKQLHSNIHTEVPVELVRADSLGKDVLRDGGSTASSGDTVTLGELRYQRKWYL